MPPNGEGGTDVSGLLAGIWGLVESVLDDSAPALEALGLSPKAYFLLGAVERHPFPAELSRSMHLPPPTVTYLVKQLEARGFLERRAEPGDLRKFRLIPTASGTEALRRGQEALGQALGRRLGRLEAAEVLAFERAVRRLADRDGD